MVFLELTEWFVIALIILIFATQIFIPLWRGEKLFPIFRKKLKRVDEELAEVWEDIEVGHKKRKLKRLKKTAEDLESEEESQNHEVKESEDTNAV